jgi:hypothetical protein
MTSRRRQPRRACGPVARFFRGALMVLLGAAFGLGAGALGIHGLLTATVGPLKPDGWGAAPAWLLFMALGGAAGLIVGATLTLSRVRRSEMHALGLFDWLGLLAGLVLAVLLFQLVSDRYYWSMKALWLAVIVPPSLVVGRAVIGRVFRDRIQSRRFV